jgi:hypothetical protein
MSGLPWLEREDFGSRLSGQRGSNAAGRAIGDQPYRIAIEMRIALSGRDVPMT